MLIKGKFFNLILRNFFIRIKFLQAVADPKISYPRIRIIHAIQLNSFGYLDRTFYFICYPIGKYNISIFAPSSVIIFIFSSNDPDFS